MNNNCQEYDFRIESLLLHCNKPFHFSSNDLGGGGGGGGTPIYWDMGCAIFRLLFRLEIKFFGLFCSL